MGINYIFATIPQNSPFALPYDIKYYITQYCTMQNTDPHIMQHPTNPTTSNPITQSHTIKCHVTQDPSVTCVMWHGMVLCHMCCDNIRLHTVLHTIPYYVIPYHTIPCDTINQSSTPLPYHIRGRLERTLSRIKKGRPDLSWGKETDWGNKTQKRFCNRQIILTFLEFWIVL